MSEKMDTVESKLSEKRKLVRVVGYWNICVFRLTNTKRNTKMSKTM